MSPSISLRISFLVAVTTAGLCWAQPGPSPFSRPDQWAVQGGKHRWSDSGVRLTCLARQSWAFYRGAAFADTSVRVRCRVGDEGDGVKAAGLILRSSDSRTAYFVHYDTRNDQIILSRNAWGEAHHEIIRRREIPLETGRWYDVRADMADGKLTVYLDGQEMLSGEDNALAAGFAGVYTSQGQVDFEQFTVTGTEAETPQDWRIRTHHEVPKDQGIAMIEDISVICKQDGRYIGWPTVCRRRNGELLAAFSGDRDRHVCPWGKVQLVRSTDDGKTWSEPASICNTPLDDRDAGIIETKQGTLVVAWFTSLAFEGTIRGSSPEKLKGDSVLNQWRLHAEKLTPEIRQQWLGYWTRRSGDGGKTWDAPVKTRGSTPHGPIELTDGRLLYVGRRNPHRDTELTVEESRDDGKSWQQIASIEAAPGDAITGFHEPHVVEAGDGALVAQFRYHWSHPETKKRDGWKDFLRQAISTDGGKTWTPAVATPLLGYPPHLIRLANNTIVSVYGRRLPPYGEYACISRDNGRTWDVDNEIKLASAVNGDLGYPASTQLSDGSILTVYYQILEPGEKTCLMGTRWRLKDRQRWSGKWR